MQTANNNKIKYINKKKLKRKKIVHEMLNKKLWMNLSLNRLTHTHRITCH